MFYSCVTMLLCGTYYVLTSRENAVSKLKKTAKTVTSKLREYLPTIYLTFTIIFFLIGMADVFKLFKMWNHMEKSRRVIMVMSSINWVYSIISYILMSVSTFVIFHCAANSFPRCAQHIVQKWKRVAWLLTNLTVNQACDWADNFILALIALFFTWFNRLISYCVLNIYWNLVEGIEAMPRRMTRKDMLKYTLLSIRFIVTCDLVVTVLGVSGGIIPEDNILYNLYQKFIYVNIILIAYAFLSKQPSFHENLVISKIRHWGSILWGKFFDRFDKFMDEEFNLTYI